MNSRAENQTLFVAKWSVVLLASTLASLALVACGAKNDPVADYSDLRAGAVAPYSQTKVIQTAAVDRFKLGVYDARDVEVKGALTFEIGKPVTYKVVGGIYESGVDSILKVSGLPPGMLMVGDLAHPKQYLISGTPLAQGCIAGGKPRVVSFAWEISNQEKISKSLFDTITMQTSRSKDYAFSAGVSAGDLVIKSVVGLERGVDQGRSTRFEVIVSDPNSDSAHKPALLILPDVGSGVGGRSSLSVDQMITPNVGQGARMQDGNWKFNRELKVLPVLTSTTGRFILKAIGTCLQNQSQALTETVTIRIAAAAPAAPQAPIPVPPIPPGAAPAAPQAPLPEPPIPPVARMAPLPVPPIPPVAARAAPQAPLPVPPIPPGAAPAAPLPPKPPTTAK